MEPMEPVGSPAHPLIGNTAQFEARASNGPFVSRQQVDSAAVLTWQEIEALVNDTGLARNLLIDGQERQNATLDQVRLGLAHGASLQLEDIGVACPRIRSLAADLTACIGYTPIDVNLYLSPTPKHVAFQTHHDMFDFLVVQIHGQKHWHVYEPQIIDPVFGLARPSYSRASSPVVMDVVLEPGDVLYVRRGDPHDAVTIGHAPSVHVNFRLHYQTGQDFLQWFVGRVLAQAPARRTCPIAVGDPPRGPHRIAWVRSLLENIEQVLALGPSALLTEFEEAVAASRPHPDRLCFPAATAQATPIEPDTLVALAPRATVFVQGNTVRAFDQSIYVSSPLLPVIESLSGTPDHGWSASTLARVHQLDVRDVLSLLRRLAAINAVTDLVPVAAP